MAAPIERLDVPLPVVTPEAVLCESQARHAACGNEQEVVADGEALRLLRHPELCTTESGDPTWEAWLAQRIAANTQAWNAHHQAGGQA
jgi:hypothetical protein